MNNEEKTIIVIGAGGGLGRALCLYLQELKYKVICAGKANSSLERFATASGFPLYTFDASSFAETSAAFEEIAKQHPRLDGAVNATGSLLLKPAHTTTEEEWLSTVANNLTSSFTCVKFASKSMFSQGGSIVLISSAASFAGIPNHDAIAAAKGGVSALARSAAATYARQKIRINAVAPGFLQTPLTKAITDNQALLESSTEMYPLGRIGTPADVVPAIEWLLSDASSWVTGEVIKIDGGMASLKKKAQLKSKV